MIHIILLGDSVFDNAAYVGRDPDVLRQLEQILPRGRKATLLARDGAVISEIGSQLRRLPSDATHLVISVGGNDALRESGVLESSALSGHPDHLIQAKRDEFFWYSLSDQEQSLSCPRFD